MIAIPSLSFGAMENWGLITYRLSALLYDVKNSAISDKKAIASIIGHELAHQVLESHWKSYVNRIEQY